jgi:hypothetical protein
VKRIIRGLGPHRLLGVVVAALLLGVIAGAGALPVERASAQANGTVNVQKALELPDGTPINAAGLDLSGFVFTIRPDTGGTAIALPATNANGQTSISVAPGNYVLQEQERFGYTFNRVTLNGVATGSFAVPAGGAVSLGVVNRVQGTGRITITKQIVDAAGNVLANQDASGFSFTVAGPNNFSQTVTTPANGIVAVPNLGAGNYSVTESPRAGFTYYASAVDGVPVSNGQAFPVTAGQQRNVIFQNRAGAGTASVSITKEIVDANNAVVPGADRSGFQFTVTCGSFSGTGTTDANGVATISNVPAGNCQVNEAARTGFTLVSIVPTGGTDIGNNGTIMVTAGQTFNLRVRNRGGGDTEAVALPTGCSNQALTWPVGTPLTTVAAAVTPPGNLLSIFKLDPIQQRFRGYSPTAPAFANDYTMVETRLEAVFFCVSAPSTLNRPR